MPRSMNTQRKGKTLSLHDIIVINTDMRKISAQAGMLEVLRVRVELVELVETETCWNLMDTSYWIYVAQSSVSNTKKSFTRMRCTCSIVSISQPSCASDTTRTSNDHPAHARGPILTNKNGGLRSEQALEDSRSIVP